MEERLTAVVRRFLAAFENVFDKDWDYTKEMLGIQEQTEEQDELDKKLGLEPIHIVSPDGTFLDAQVDDETEEWGHRGELLSAYRELKKLL